MLDTSNKVTDALVRAMSDAFTHGWTTEDIDEITQMVAAQQPRTLTELARHMAEDAGRDELPTYAEAPPGMIDVATAVREYGFKKRTVNGWIQRGMVPVLGTIRGRGGNRVLVCEQTLLQTAQMPKNKGGRPRKTLAR